MRTTYEFAVKSLCPVDTAVVDLYEVVLTVEDGELLPVERILEAVATATREPVFQEDFTIDLAFRLGVRVRTTGMHSGVRVVCEAP